MMVDLTMVRAVVVFRAGYCNISGFHFKTTVLSLESWHEYFRIWSWGYVTHRAIPPQTHVHGTGKDNLFVAHGPTSLNICSCLDCLTHSKDRCQSRTYSQDIWCSSRYFVWHSWFGPRSRDNPRHSPKVASAYNGVYNTCQGSSEPIRRCQTTYCIRQERAWWVEGNSRHRGVTQSWYIYTVQHWWSRLRKHTNQIRSDSPYLWHSGLCTAMKRTIWLGRRSDPERCWFGLSPWNFHWALHRSMARNGKADLCGFPWKSLPLSFCIRCPPLIWWLCCWLIQRPMPCCSLQVWSSPWCCARIPV